MQRSPALGGSWKHAGSLGAHREHETSGKEGAARGFIHRRGSDRKPAGIPGCWQRRGADPPAVTARCSATAGTKNFMAARACARVQSTRGDGSAYGRENPLRDKRVTEFEPWENRRRNLLEGQLCAAPRAGHLSAEQKRRRPPADAGSEAAQRCSRRLGAPRAPRAGRLRELLHSCSC